LQIIFVSPILLTTGIAVPSFMEGVLFMRRPCDENKLKSKLRFLFLTNPLMIYKTTDGQILTRDAVRILICCIYEINDAFYFEYQIQCNHLDAYLEKYMNHIELYTALKYLQKIGYAENLTGNKDDFSFNLTYSAMNYFELRNKNFLFTLFNSIFLPVIVSAITALLIAA